MATRLGRSLASGWLAFAVVCVLLGCGRFRFQLSDDDQGLDGGNASPDGAQCGAPCDTGDPCVLGVLDCSGTPTCVPNGMADDTVMCRPAASQCDAPEFCQSGACPADALAVSRCPDALLAACGSVCDGLSEACSACPNYLQFDGDDLLTLPDEPLASVPFRQPASLSVWVWVDADAMTDPYMEMYLARMPSMPNVVSTPAFDYTTLSSPPAVLGPCWRTQGLGSVVFSCTLIDDAVLAPPGRWVHIASVSDNGVQNYVDGQRSTVSTEELLLGSVQRRVGDHFIGRIRNLSLWRVALTEERVRTLSDGAAISADDPDLLEWWPMDEGSGTTTRSMVTNLDAQFGASGSPEPANEPTWGP